MLRQTSAIDGADPLAVLRGSAIADTLTDARCDEITSLAATLFEVPDALVSPIDANRIWRRRLVPAAHAADAEASTTLVIEDTLADASFAKHPLVTASPRVRFYAGRALTSAGGMALGTLCLVDYRPRDFGARDREIFVRLAGLAEHEIAVSRLAITDELTGLFNRRGFERVADQALETCRRTGRSATLLYADLDRFKTINDTFGHAAGDAVLTAFARLLVHSFRSSDIVGRLGGDEFVVLLTDVDPLGRSRAVERLRAAASAVTVAAAGGTAIHFSSGTADFDPARHTDAERFVADADGSMYEDKESHRACPFQSDQLGCTRPPAPAD